jgi:predicted RNA-binding protein YlqC (UPF0109 family)
MPDPSDSNRAHSGNLYLNGIIDAGVASTLFEGNTDMKEYVEHIVRALVDNPDQVQINEVEGNRTTVYELRVGQGDLGKVIGKQGQTAKAIRTLLAAAAARKGKRAVLEILE